VKARLSPLNSILQFITKLKNNITQRLRAVFQLRFANFSSSIGKCFCSSSHKQNLADNARQQLHNLWSDAFDLFDDPICFIDLNDCLVNANHAFFCQIDLPKEKALGHPVSHLINDSTDQTICQACIARRSRKDITITKEANDPSNPQASPVEIRIRIMRDQHNTPIGILQTQHDLSRLRSTQTALRMSKSKLAEAQRIAGMGNWEWDIKQNKFYWSTEMSRIFGVTNTANDNHYESFLTLIHAEDRPLVRSTIQNAIKNGQQGFTVDHRIHSINGVERIVKEQGKLFYDENRVVTRMAGIAHDITEQKRAEEALEEEKERAQITLQSIGDAVITSDIYGVIDYINAKAEQLFDIRFAEVIGKHYHQVLHIVDEQNRQPIANLIHKLLVKPSEIQHEHLLLIRNDGKEYCINITATPIVMRQQCNTGISFVLHDVTQMRLMTRRLDYQASHDSLTNLYNRRKFEQQLQLALHNIRQHQQSYSLIYMDLDQFKIVNDTCGHIAGDELLKQVAELLAPKIRAIDVFARLGGDEFAVLLQRCPLDTSKKIAETIRKTIDSYRFAWENKEFKISVSIGLIPINESSGNITDILKAADSACYIAKDQGRNRVFEYGSDNPSVEQHHGQIQWVQRITHALEHDQFRLFCQTIQPLAQHDSSIHCEILLRMINDDNSIIPPDAFIPAAERYQLMPSIDRWVIQKTLQTLQAVTPMLHNRRFLCAINLSGQSLNDNDFLTFVMQCLVDTNIPLASLCFEITETTAIANLTSAGRFITALRDLGVQFSLDDFGSGLSSFNYLKKLTIDYVKIDGQFVKDIIHDPIDLAMVTSINEIAHKMGVATIAEYVENQAILEHLQAMHIDYVQGSLIGNAQPFEQYFSQFID